MPDLSGHSNAGTLNGKTQWSPISQSSAGLGLSFDGSSTYVSVPDSPTFPSSSFSVSLWLYPTGAFPPGTTRIVAKDKRQSTPYQGWLVLYDGSGFGRIYLAVFNTASSEYDSPLVQLTLNALNHIVFTFDGSNNNIKAYLNGLYQTCFSVCTLSGTFQKSTNALL